jgi:hypothetical protein
MEMVQEGQRIRVEKKPTSLMDRVTQARDAKDYEWLAKTAKERVLTGDEYKKFETLARNLGKWRT